MSDIKQSFKESQYSPSDAYWMAKMALSAYDPSAKVQKEVEELGFTDFEFFDNKGTQAFCCSDDEKVILSFRGTEASHIEDIISDARVLKTEGPFGKVHRGFKFALDNVWSDVESKVKSLEGKRLYITGHSLGAALATLAAATFSNNDVKPESIYTFGQPKVGNKSFAKEYNGRLGEIHNRFVNNNDVVTRVPNVGFEHIGKFIYINHKGELVYNINLLKLEADRLAGRVSGRLKNLTKIGSDGTADHSMVNYLEFLEKNISFNPFSNN
ncbi:MAG: lipase family protein [Lentisphaeraceae bacterium]|nr:lipase family protein [Lentisphaeraceae bacterium]